MALNAVLKILRLDRNELGTLSSRFPTQLKCLLCIGFLYNWSPVEKPVIQKDQLATGSSSLSIGGCTLDDGKRAIQAEIMFC